MRFTMPLDRRDLLGALALSPMIPTGFSAVNAATSVEAGLLVAGPPGARLDRWAEPLSNAIGRSLPSRTPLTRQNIGGLDGVTGANTFDTRMEPDGSTALLVPGAATLSWLVGETRARFDPARWLLLWAITAPAVLVSRTRLQPGRKLRIAASSPVGSELPALMALDMIGIYAPLTPAPDAEAMLLQGPNLPALLEAAAARDMNPVLTLGQVGPDGTIGRDPLLPTVASAVELVQGRASPAMTAALIAACLAVQLDAGLILQQLTPAATVSAWRRACQSLLHDASVLAEAAQQGARMLPAAGAADVVGHIAGNPALLLELRQWLATRYDWRPA